MAPSKPLAEVLREAKEAKEEAFQAVWRQMKTGAPPGSSVRIGEGEIEEGAPQAIWCQMGTGAALGSCAYEGSA